LTVWICYNLSEGQAVMRENQLETTGSCGSEVTAALHWLCIGFALALHWLCIGFALGLHVFFRSDLLCNLQSLHRLLPKEAATSATIEIKTIETGDIVESKMRVLRV